MTATRPNDWPPTRYTNNFIDATFPTEIRSSPFQSTLHAPSQFLIESYKFFSFSVHT